MLYSPFVFEVEYLLVRLVALLEGGTVTVVLSSIGVGSKDIGRWTLLCLLEIPGSHGKEDVRM